MIGSDCFNRGLSKRIILLLSLAMWCLLVSPSTANQSQADANDQPVAKLRRIFLPFEDLGEWMKTQPAYLPMSYQRYSNLVAFANRKQGSAVAQPIRHHLNLSRSGYLEGESWFRIPERGNSTEDKRIDLLDWTLPGTFSQATFPSSNLIPLDYRSAESTMLLNPVAIGIDQDGRFGLTPSGNSNLLVAKFDLNVSTGDLFDGQRSISLPTIPETQVYATVPDGIEIILDDQSVITPIHWVPESGIDPQTVGSRQYLIATTGTQLQIKFSSIQALVPNDEKEYLEYSENSRISVDVGKQSFESTILITNTHPVAPKNIEVILPKGFDSRTCFANGKPGQGQLQFHSDGRRSWHVPVEPSDFPLELIIDGSLDWLPSQMHVVPRVQVRDGIFVDGTSRVETLRPTTIQDFQLINCRFEESTKDSTSREVRVRYLSADSQFRVLTANNDFAPDWKSFSRINFQDDFLQSQQWIDFDFRFAVNTTLKFRLDHQWNIGQLTARIQNQATANEQTLRWYRDSQTPDVLMLDVPDNLLGQQVRIRFQGRRRIEFGVHKYFEGLAPLTLDSNRPIPWKRLVALTSNSPTIANVSETFQDYSIEPELSRQQNLNFATLIQLEPTFDFIGNQEIEFEVQYRDTSSYSVIGTLENRLLSQQLLLQTFQFQLATSGSSLQQFPVDFNVDSSDQFVWDLRDADNQSIEYSTEIDAEHPNRIWFQLKDPISTTLTLHQTRQIAINGSDGQAFPLPVYSFPQAIHFETRVVDHSECGFQLWYPNGPSTGNQSTTGLPNGQPVPTNTKMDAADIQKMVRFVYRDDFGAPSVRCLPDNSRDTQLLIDATDYLHKVDAKQILSSCHIRLSSFSCDQLEIQLPENAVPDSVLLNGLPTPFSMTDSGIVIPVIPFSASSIELKYSIENVVELYQFSPIDPRINFTQPPVSETQAVILADGLTMWSPNNKSSTIESLISRWLFTQPAEFDWNLNASSQRWYPRNLLVDGFCIANQRNLVALRWLLSMVFLIVGFLFWSSVLYVGQSRWTLNPPLIILIGLLVVSASLPLAQLGAAACWGIMGGHVLGYIRSRTQKQLKLITADRLLSTLSRSLTIVLVTCVATNPTSLSAQEAPAEKEHSTVVIPTDEDGNPGSVVYLDKKTYSLLSELEKEFGKQTQINIQSSLYRLFYSPTKAGYDKLQCSFAIRARTGGTIRLPLPTQQADTISDVQIDGIPAGYRIENGQVLINVPSAELLNVSFETGIPLNDKTGYLSIKTLPAADNTLELRGVPTTWMVQLFDEQQANLLQRSFSKRTFQLGRVQQLGIHIAADRVPNLEPAIETQLNITLSRVTGQSWIQLGLYRRMTNKIVIQTDSRLSLPARYYFATAGFQISEIDSDQSSNTYEITFADSEAIPERFKIDWDTKLGSVGQLVAPQVRLLSPNVNTENHIGLKIDPRLVFQPNAIPNGFSRVTQKRFPSQQAMISTEPLDFVFQKRTGLDTGIASLGELRMQPVQANGNLNLKYYVDTKRIRWDFDGQINLVLGELPQLRLPVPKDFKLSEVFLSNDFQNQVLWTNTVKTETGYELICFLGQPLSGNLQLRLSGTQPISEPIFTGLFNGQMPNLKYVANLYHSPDLSVETQTQLQPSVLPTASDLEFELHQSFQLSSEQAANGFINVQAQPKNKTKQLTTFAQVRTDNQKNESVTYLLAVDAGLKPVEDLTFQIPAGLGQPELIDVSQQGQSLATTVELNQSGDQIKLRWLQPSSKTFAVVSFPITKRQGNLPLADFSKVGGQHFLLQDGNVAKKFKLNSQPISMPDLNQAKEIPKELFEIFSQSAASANRNWFQLNQQPTLQYLERINSETTRREWPVLEFQQFNYRTCWLEGTASLDGLQQFVLRSRSNDHSVKLVVPDGCKVVNAWVNNRLIAPRVLPSGPETSEIEIAIDPTKKWHVITLRLQLNRSGKLPELRSVEDQSVLFAPAVANPESLPESPIDAVVSSESSEEPSAVVSSYAVALNQIGQLIDDPDCKNALLQLTSIEAGRNSTASADELDTVMAEDLTTLPSTDAVPSAAVAENGEALVDTPKSETKIVQKLVNQFSNRRLVATSNLSFQPDSRAQPALLLRSMGQALISIFGVLMVATMLWKSETHSKLLCVFTGILAFTYGWIATLYDSNWTVGLPLLAFAVLTFSFVVRQKLYQPEEAVN